MQSMKAHSPAFLSFYVPAEIQQGLLCPYILHAINESTEPSILIFLCTSWNTAESSMPIHLTCNQWKHIAQHSYLFMYQLKYCKVFYAHTSYIQSMKAHSPAFLSFYVPAEIQQGLLCSYILHAINEGT